MHISSHHNKKRQAGDPTLDTLNINGVAGVDTLSPVEPSGTGVGLNLDTTAAPDPSLSAPPIVPASTPVITVSSPSLTASPPSDSSVSASQAPTANVSSSASKNSAISLSTVIGACVGAFAGLLLVLCLYVWFNKRHKKWKASVAASQARLPSDARNAHGQMEQRRSRGRSWNQLQEKDQDMWVGMSGTQLKETDEKQLGISNLFKKSPSMRTTRTAKTASEEDHSYDLPPFEFSQYHPELAAQLALEHPGKPFAKREDSGTSWDGDTIAEETVMSLRSGRVDSGTMSPTLAKMCPPATHLMEHKWESAEVLHMEQTDDAMEIENPFTDVMEEKRKSSTNNPFFSARELQRSVIRSRSNSNARVSRAYSRSSVATRAVSPELSSTTTSTISHLNPFSDPVQIPVMRAVAAQPPTAIILPSHSHIHNDSSASDSSDQYTPHAMQLLIAALDIPQAAVEARLRAVSDSATTSESMRSSFSQASSLYTFGDDDSDIATVRNFPMPPAPAHHPS